MTPDERAQMVRLCDAMSAERDLTKVLGIAQQLNALLDRALVRKERPSLVRGDPSENVSQPVESMEPES